MALAEQRSVLQVVAGGDGEGQAPAVVLEVAGEHFAVVGEQRLDLAARVVPGQQTAFEEGAAVVASAADHQYGPARVPGDGVERKAQVRQDGDAFEVAAAVQAQALFVDVELSARVLPMKGAGHREERAAGSLKHGVGLADVGEGASGQPAAGRKRGAGHGRYRDNRVGRSVVHSSFREKHEKRGCSDRSFSSRMALPSSLVAAAVHRPCVDSRHGHPGDEPQRGARPGGRGCLSFYLESFG